jgi:photoprotection regulator FRP-like protein
MDSLPQSAKQTGRTTMHDLTWSHAEKVVAREAFRRALDKEFQLVMRTTREMAKNIEQPSDLWELEGYLTRSRREIDRQYDYRYSVLPLVFGNLVRQGRLSMEDLRELREDKLEAIRSYVRVFGDLDAA